MRYRVVWEIEADAEDPLAAALQMRDLREDHQHHPVLMVYSDTYKVVHEVDLGKPADQAVTVITPPAVSGQIEERDF